MKRRGRGILWNSTLSNAPRRASPGSDPSVVSSPAVSPDDPHTFGRFTLLEVLGEGGMGRVYRAAIDGPSGFRKELALKVLRADAHRDPERLAAGLAKEARIGALLRHPNLVDLYDHGVDEGRPWFSMELVRGRSLDALIAAEGPVDPPRAVRLLAQIALGLSAIHELEIDGAPGGLVHRDLKPANVLVTADDHVQIADFGISRGQHELLATRTESLKGTPAYMSPEQAREGALTARSDLFALGLIGWELVTGERFLTGASIFEVMFSILQIEQRLDAVRALDADLPGFGAVLADCLREEPALRPPSARAVRDRLLALQLRPVARRSPETTATTLNIDVLPEEGLDGRPPPGNLRPGLDAFVGRDAELEAIVAALEPPGRVLSLLGAGGSGKTRLARELGLGLRGDYPGGVWFVDLTEARSLGGVCAAVAGVLDVPLASGVGEPAERLGAAIAGRGRALLLLDNFEQVAAVAADTVGVWAPRCPAARFVVTTRQRLGIGGEHVVRVGPLRTPPAAGLALDDLGAVPAVRLFVDRARLRRPDFELNDENAADVASLVRALDGIPLAIELAAARSRVLSPARLLERLPERFDLLSTGRTDVTGRQATLKATIEWSWDLLEPWERQGLAASSVFRGGFTVEAAEAVLDLSAWPQAPWVLDVVEALEDKSLLRSVEAPSGEIRFFHYESIREFAAEKLREAGATAAAEARHIRWFAARGTPEALDSLSTKGSSIRRQRLGEDLENLAAAAERALGVGESGAAAQATLAAVELLAYSGPLETAQRLLDEALAPGDLDPLLRARALLARAVVRSLRADAEGAEADAVEAEALAHAAGDRVLEASAWSERGRIRLYGPEAGQTDLLERALAVFVAAGDRLREGRTLGLLATRDSVQGRFQRSRSRNEEALMLVKRTDDRLSELAALGNLAIAYKELSMGVLELATLNEALRLSRELGATRQEAVLLLNQGVHHQNQGRLARAEELYRAAGALCRDIGLRDLEEIALANLGDALKDQGRFEAAEEPLRAGLQLAQRRDNERIRAGIHAMLAQVLLGLGRLDEAGEQIEAATAISATLGSPRIAGEAATWRADWRRRAGRWSEARAALADAEARLAALPESRYVLRARVEGARVDLDAGDPAAARARADALVDEVRAVQDPLLLGLLLATRGGAEAALGDDAARAATAAELADTLDGLELAPSSPLRQALSALRR